MPSRGAGHLTSEQLVSPPSPTTLWSDAQELSARSSAVERHDRGEESVRRGPVSTAPASLDRTRGRPTPVTQAQRFKLPL